MILDNTTDTVILEEGEVQESTKMEIDIDSHAFLMRMLSKFYSDAIGSLIRESASNALDSHREAGIEEPIIVALKQDNNGNWEFSVEDHGVGMDDKDVQNVISKYGKSTKRQSVNQLGAFGLGFKSSLAYTSSFYFIGRKNGVERKWMMYEGEDEINKIDLLHEKPTEERNGVKIIVPVKYGDRSNFESKIREQLAYFEHVYFEVPNIKNDFTIVRHQDFQWSELATDNNLHINLDNVYYSLDYSKLGISRINFPVALRFSLTDGLFPLPARESIKYTPDAKAIILKKLEQVADYFVTKYNESIKDTDKIEDIFSYYNTGSRNVGGFGKTSWDVQLLKQYSKIKFIEPKLKGVEISDLSRIFLMKDSLVREYDKVYEFRNGRFNTLKGKWSMQFNYSDLSKKLYVFTEGLSFHKKAYLREQLGKGYYNSCYFVEKVRKTPLFPQGGFKNAAAKNADNYTTILKLYNYPKSQWRQLIKEFQYIQGLLTSKFIDADKIEIPQEWFDSKKKQKVQIMTAKGTNIRRKKLEGELTAKIACDLERYVSGKECKFVPEVIQMKDAHRNKKFNIYTGTENTAKIDKLFTVVKKDKIQLLVLSDREMKNMSKVELHNWMNLEEFMKGENKAFKRIVTAYLINKLYKQYPSVFNEITSINLISTDLGAKVEILDNYKDSYYIGSGNVELYNAMLEVAESKNLFDPTVYSTYKEVKKVIEKLPFLNVMLSKMNRYDEPNELLTATKDLFKYYKQKMNWENYKIVLNEEVVEPVTEELIEELT